MSGKFRGPAAEESIACNLIPMIDVMFLLLLFFMLGADMTQRELEEVKLPKADCCVKDDPVANRWRRTNVNVYHADAASGVLCSIHAAGGACRDPEHWRVAIRANEYEYMSGDFAAWLKDDAAPDREVMIRADEGAPYAVVQKIIEGCASAGLRRVVVGAAPPAGMCQPAAQPTGF